MQNRGYHFDNYSFDGNNINEGNGIDKVNEKFYWWYTERGKKRIIQEFENEISVVNYAFEKIKNDIWGKAYLLGSTDDKNKSDELCLLLSKMEIDYIQNDIPNYSGGKAKYRVFVIGKSINRVKHLKNEYYD